MDHVFRIIIVSALVYIGYLGYVAKNNKPNLREQIFNRLSDQLYSEKMQSMIKDVGWEFTSQTYNLIRYISVASYVLLSYVTQYIRGEVLSPNILAIAAVILLLSSPLKFSPTTWLFKKIKQRQLINKDSEIISFLNLYKANRKNTFNNIQFWAFCSQVAPHFKYIKKELYHLSERIHEEGIEKSLEWFVSRFPADHPYIYDVQSIILAVESERDPKNVAIFLESQTKVIAEMSRSQYQERWSALSSITSVINVLPSAATFIMLIMLVLQYVFILSKNSIFVY